jgi:tRNA pseudouridine55 synthase
MTADGLVIVDKPAGLTSHDVVSRMRRIAATRRVGHAGTLDPMATGVLVLAVGQATRLLQYLELGDKSYHARIRLGQATTTDDREGTVVLEASAAEITEAQLRAAVGALTGEILQVPASVSAIKVDGQRAYKRVRDGEDVQLSPRPVTVRRFDVIAVERSGPLLDLDVEVDCSGGTYVRSLARDLGATLGVGGHLTALRRVQVGRFGIAEARTLADLADAGDPVSVSIADAAAAVMPVRPVDATEVSELSFGRALPPTGASGLYAAIGPDGGLAAVLREDERSARPILVLPAST